MYKLAIIGAGAISESHLKACVQLPGIRAVAIADVVPERAEAAGSRYGIQAYGDYRRMVEQEKPDIVAITLPHFLHKPAAVWCAEHGCHLMLEKPMALNAKECDEIMDAVESNGVRLLVGHTQHYIPENRAAKQLLDRGDLGELLTIQDTRHVDYYLDTRPAWFFEQAKSGGGIMMNLGSHSIDKIQWLTDSRVASLHGRVARPGHKGDIEGSGVVFLLTSTGLPATITQSGYGGVNRNETELLFTGGMLKLVTGRSLWISEGGAYREIPVDKGKDPFILQYEDLIDSIQRGVDPECSGSYGRSVIAAVEAIYESDRTGGQVAVPINDRQREEPA